MFLGGWAGHYPEVIAKFALEQFLADYDVDVADDLASLETAHLLDYDLIVPIWTVETLTVNQEIALVTVIEHGVGMVTRHGTADAFTADAFNEHHLFHFVLGGQFICHPRDPTQAPPPNQVDRDGGHLAHVPPRLTTPLPVRPCRKYDPALDLALRLREIAHRAVFYVTARRQNRNNNPRSHRHPT